ncbi:hypothetical protein BZY94_42000, partial [Burkholderia territorii]
AIKMTSPGAYLAVTSGRLDPAALEPGVDWPELHDSYQEVLDKLRETSNFEDGAKGDGAAVKVG